MERRSGKERRKKGGRSGKRNPALAERRSGLDRRDMSRNLCPYIEKTDCTAWRERTLGHIIHISRYCREYYIFCEFYKELEARKGDRS